jgi:hypothetical protein
VKVAVGINSNNMVTLIQKQETELNIMKDQMNVVLDYLKKKDPSFNTQKNFNIRSQRFGFCYE